MSTSDTADAVLDRGQFPVLDKHAYLDCASVGPPPRVVSDAVQQCLGDFADEGSLALPTYFMKTHMVRQLAAEAMGVHGNEVSFVRSTTAGLSQIARGLHLPQKATVLLPRGEFPTLSQPFTTLPETETRWVGTSAHAATLEDYRLALATDPAPGLVVVSSVNQAYQTVDLAALADLVHDRGSLLCVDLIRSVGVQPVDLRAWGVDFAVANSYKWLLSGPSAGLLYIAAEHLDRVTSLEPGWMSTMLGPAGTLDWAPDARRYEGGTPNIVGLVSLGAALELLGETGLDKIWAHVQNLHSYAEQQLTEIGLAPVACEGPGLGPSACLLVPIADPSVKAHLLSEDRVIVGANGDGLCVSLHGFNNGDDINQLVESLKKICHGNRTPS